MSSSNSARSFFCCCRPETYSPSKKSHDRESPSKSKIEEIALHSEVVGDRQSAGVVPFSGDEMRQANGIKIIVDERPLNMEALKLENGFEEKKETEPLGNEISHQLKHEGPHTMKEDTAEEKNIFSMLPSDFDNQAEYVSHVEGLIVRLETVANILESAGVAEESNGDLRLPAVKEESSISNADSRNIAASCILYNDTWKVENHHCNQDLMIHVTDDHHNVAINNCDQCTIRIEGKANQIAIGNCMKCGVVFNDVASSVNIMDCQRIQIQGLGFVPSIHAKVTDGLSIYLNSNSSEVPIFTSKCSELNVLIPSEDNNEDFKEIAIPEQFRSHWNGERWVTEVSDIIN